MRPLSVCGCDCVWLWLCLSFCGCVGEHSAVHHEVGWSVQRCEKRCQGHGQSLAVQVRTCFSLHFTSLLFSSFFFSAMCSPLLFFNLPSARQNRKSGDVWWLIGLSRKSVHVVCNFQSNEWKTNNGILGRCSPPFLVLFTLHFSDWLNVRRKSLTIACWFYIIGKWKLCHSA